MKILIGSAILSIVIAYSNINPQQILIDGFENPENWKVISSDAAKIKISNAEGKNGKCLKIEYEFLGAGYCGIEREYPFELPDNYKFILSLKGDSPKNNLEFKLIDKSGDNVWWKNQRYFDFPSEWQNITIRKKDIEFAWGPIGGGEVKSFEKFQIVIAAAEGGQGTIYLDDLKFEKMPEHKDYAADVVVYSSNPKDTKLNYISDNNFTTSWKSKSKPEKQNIIMDLQSVIEIGGLVVHWDDKDFAVNYDISISNDRVNWELVYTFAENKLNRNYIYLNNTDTRYIRLNLKKSNRRRGYSIKEIEIKPPQFSKSLNEYFTNIAHYYKEGCFPKYFYNKQTYWTIIGVSEDSKEALINEQGMIEVDKQSFSLEPFIQLNNNLITWKDITTKQSLEDNYLPIPTVTWMHPLINLNITAFAYGEPNKSNLLVRYRLINTSKKTQSGNLLIAIRPYQVNPKWQFLNNEGGTAKIKTISFDENIITINIDKKIFPLVLPNDFGATKFSEGEIIDYLLKNSIPSSKTAIDEFGFASACIKYDFNIEPSAMSDFIFIIPFYQDSQLTFLEREIDPTNYFDEELFKEVNSWKEKFHNVKIQLPALGEKITNTIKSNLAYILINKDGPSIQPGSRSYERSWIRDGALTSSALLRFGFKKEVRNFLDWFSQFQFPSGKIPCVVDKRGADPTPENDSHGEFIFAVLQYFKFTHDTLFLKSKLNNVIDAVNYIESLTNQRKTEQYIKEDSLVFYGLMPESISHEGYSAKPMHSYWDNFFTIRGLSDAVEIAKILNEKDLYKRFLKLKDEFEINLHNSIKLAIKNHNIDYIPGCAELGDFDATSTTIAIFPVNEHNKLPQKELLNTFEKYFEFFQKRKSEEIDWINYTPYELRIVGSFIYLGQRERAHDLLDFFFTDQRPKEWNHWAEVVWKNIDEPRFIGDMPHTWVGSDYINAVRAMFVYENELDSTLVLGAGLKKEWINSPEGLSVTNLPTYYGDISYSLMKKENLYQLEISGDLHTPVKKIVFKNFLKQRPSKVYVNGKISEDYNKTDLFINSLPANVLLKFE